MIKIGNQVEKRYWAIGESWFTEDWETSANGFPELLCEAAKLGDIGCNMDDLRGALRMCRSSSFTSRLPSMNWWTELIDSLSKKIEKSGFSESTSYWIETLLEVNMDGADIKRLLSSINKDDIIYKLYPLMEKWADEFPTEYVINWYAEMVKEENLPQQIIERGYNRLAFFYLRIRRQHGCKEAATNYFKKMKEKGIERRNPYSGPFGNMDHNVLIEALLDGSYEDKKVELAANYCEQATEYIVSNVLEPKEGRWWIRETSDGRDNYNIKRTEQLNDDNYMELRDNMEMALDGLYEFPDKGALNNWDTFLKKYYRSIKKCLALNNSSGDRVAEALLKLLYKGDNWLLRCLKLTVETDEKYYGLIEEWIDEIKSLNECELSFIQSSLYGLLINYYIETEAADEKLLSRLWDYIHSVDSAELFRDVYSVHKEDVYGKVFFSDNTIALMKRYIDKGMDAEADKLINEIRKTEPSIGELDVSDYKFTRLITKYVDFLSSAGKDEEAQYWLAWCNEHCEELQIYYDKELSLYWKGEYEELKKLYKNREKSKSTVALLDYMIEGPKETETIYQLPSEPTLYMRRLTFSEEVGGMFSHYYMDEWMKFYARVQDVVGLFKQSITADGERKLLERKYYEIPMCYEPNIPIVKGDYIRYIYEDSSGRNWFGKTREEVERQREKNHE